MRFGLIGYPIGHSLSPAMFRACFPDLEYGLIETPDFDEAMDIFRRKYDAVNVTAPFKSDAYSAADIRDEASTILEAANVLVRKEGTIFASNTDHTAVRFLLEKNLPAGGGHSVLVIGCGGAGRAAAFASAQLGLKTAVANRTFGKAEEFCRRAGGMLPVTMEEAIAGIRQYNAVIYTLPVGIPETHLIAESGALIIEANYRNPQLGGNRYVSGRQWLVAQAVRGFKEMTGRNPDPGVLLDAVSNQTE